jgi:hypothetical protein
MVHRYVRDNGHELTIIQVVLVKDSNLPEQPSTATTTHKPYSTASATLRDNRQTLEPSAMIQGRLPKLDSRISAPFQTYNG